MYGALSSGITYECGHIFQNTLIWYVVYKSIFIYLCRSARHLNLFIRAVAMFIGIVLFLFFYFDTHFNSVRRTKTLLYSSIASYFRMTCFKTSSRKAHKYTLQNQRLLFSLLQFISFPKICFKRGYFTRLLF